MEPLAEDEAVGDPDEFLKNMEAMGRHLFGGVDDSAHKRKAVKVGSGYWVREGGSVDSVDVTTDAQGNRCLRTSWDHGRRETIQPIKPGESIEIAYADRSDDLPHDSLGRTESMVSVRPPGPFARIAGSVGAALVALACAAPVLGFLPLVVLVPAFGDLDKGGSAFVAAWIVSGSLLCLIPAVWAFLACYRSH